MSNQDGKQKQQARLDEQADGSHATAPTKAKRVETVPMPTTGGSPMGTTIDATDLDESSSELEIKVTRKRVPPEGDGENQDEMTTEQKEEPKPKRPKGPEVGRTTQELLHVHCCPSAEHVEALCRPLSTLQDCIRPLCLGHARSLAGQAFKSITGLKVSEIKSEQRVVRVAMWGTAGKGKSLLLNRIIGEDLVVSRGGVGGGVTRTPTLVRYGEAKRLLVSRVETPLAPLPRTEDGEVLAEGEGEFDARARQLRRWQEEGYVETELWTESSTHTLQKVREEEELNPKNVYFIIEWPSKKLQEHYFEVVDLPGFGDSSHAEPDLHMAQIQWLLNTVHVVLTLQHSHRGRLEDGDIFDLDNHAWLESRDVLPTFATVLNARWVSVREKEKDVHETQISAQQALCRVYNLDAARYGLDDHPPPDSGAHQRQDRVLPHENLHHVDWLVLQTGGLFFANEESDVNGNATFVEQQLVPMLRVARTNLAHFEATQACKDSDHCIKELLAWLKDRIRQRNGNGKGCEILDILAREFDRLHITDAQPHNEDYLLIKERVEEIRSRYANATERDLSYQSIGDWRRDVQEALTELFDWVFEFSKLPCYVSRGGPEYDTRIRQWLNDMQGILSSKVGYEVNKRALINFLLQNPFRVPSDLPNEELAVNMKQVRLVQLREELREVRRNLKAALRRAHTTIPQPQRAIAEPQVLTGDKCLRLPEYAVATLQEASCRKWIACNDDFVKHSKQIQDLISRRERDTIEAILQESAPDQTLTCLAKFRAQLNNPSVIFSFTGRETFDNFRRRCTNLYKSASSGLGIYPIAFFTCKRNSSTFRPAFHFQSFRDVVSSNYIVFVFYEHDTTSTSAQIRTKELVNEAIKQADGGENVVLVEVDSTDLGIGRLRTIAQVLFGELLWAPFHFQVDDDLEFKEFDVVQREFEPARDSAGRAMLFMQKTMQKLNTDLDDSIVARRVKILEFFKLVLSAGGELSQRLAIGRSISPFLDGEAKRETARKPDRLLCVLREIQSSRTTPVQAYTEVIGELSGSPDFEPFAGIFRAALNESTREGFLDMHDFLRNLFGPARCTQVTLPNTSSKGFTKCRMYVSRKEPSNVRVSLCRNQVMMMHSASLRGIYFVDKANFFEKPENHDEIVKLSHVARKSETFKWTVKGRELARLGYRYEDSFYTRQLLLHGLGGVEGFQFAITNLSSVSANDHDGSVV